MNVVDIESTLQTLRHKAFEELRSLQDVRALDDWRVQYLGKKSELTQISRQMGALSPEERPVVGEKVNEARGALQRAYEEMQAELAQRELNRRFAEETIDVTVPGRRHARGSMHPLTQIIQEIEEVFLGMGYEVVEGPEIETDEYNFEKLNLPKHHPARDMQDTFYLTETLLLRTQTSPMQVRTMERMRPHVPVKVIVPGKVYRRDEDDATHSHMFHQIEGLVVDEGVRMSDLKGTLEHFARAIFGANQSVRLRPSFFPFTEPSAELDIRCTNCGGSGCRMCKGTGWLEILGCGMVHPKVLDGAGYDSRRYSGFAFGMGPERIAMLKYGIEDIRLLYQNDLRLLRQFNRVL
ncbi:phenylalanine--tRNA ligase subunit alpha [Alicyclobacillus pomorum]